MSLLCTPETEMTTALDAIYEALERKPSYASGGGARADTDVAPVLVNSQDTILLLNGSASNQPGPLAPICERCKGYPAEDDSPLCELCNDFENYGLRGH